jgi:hypothetical protein
VKIPDTIRTIWFIDTEFQAPDGEQNRPVCLCGLQLTRREDGKWQQGQRLEMFFDQPRTNPFTDYDATLFICYNASAEWKTFLALGWDLPSNVVDLYFEYINKINGVQRSGTTLRELGTGLVAAMREHGLDPMTSEEKEAERDNIIQNGITPPEGVTKEQHQRRILNYCWQDVDGTFALAKEMVPDLDYEQAAWRGDYSVPCAYFEHNGLPVDRERYYEIVQHAADLQNEIARKTEETHQFNVFAMEGKKKPKAVFKEDKFIELLQRHGIYDSWPKTDTGRPTKEEKQFRALGQVHPFIEPLRQAYAAKNELSRYGSMVGQDGRNRYALMPFGTVTGRNNPKATEFLLARSRWVRHLIKPPEGYALVIADIVSAESWLAAIYSGDPGLTRIYASGADSYIEFAIVTGAAPPGTVRNKKNAELERIRSMHKTALLSINYGVKEKTLSEYLGVPVWQASRIINDHREAYAVYWGWVEDQRGKAHENRCVETDFGWQMSTVSAKATQIDNFPQQAGCGEVLRAACIRLVDLGWGSALCAPHHDAIYMCVPLEQVDECKTTLHEALVWAGDEVMESPEVKLKTDIKVVEYPDRYHDPDGEPIWKMVCEYFRWDQPEVPVSPTPSVDSKQEAVCQT